MAYLMKYVRGCSRLAAFYQRRYSSRASSLLFSEEVQHAKAEGKPIVALESTIITHGMPYPQNLDTAVQVENIIRERGAVPATIAILKGQLTIGLTEDQIHYLAKAKGVVKASRRDLAPIAAAKLDGATTVAGTLIAAELADIPVFVTGGIGGVHRQGENTLDISADLNELGRSKTLVVCSGVKSILDIGKTLEYLETQGVCVCAFGESADFPAFYTPKSGYQAPHRVPDALHAAKLLDAAYSLRLGTGIVVAVPIPKEYAMDEKIIEESIQKALKKADEKGIQGKEVTPFILSAVANATGGASLNSNIALIKNNAKVGADIAVEFKKLKNVGNSFNIDIAKSGGMSSNSVRHFHSSCRTNCDSDDAPLMEPNQISDGDVLVIGGANVDRTYRLKEKRVQRACGICDKEHLDAELEHVKQVLHDNKLQQPRHSHRSRREKPVTVERQPAVLPYVQGVTDKIGYILKRVSINTYYKPPTKISQFLPSVKCQVPLQDAGVYKIDCDCGLSYIGQTKRSIGTRIKEHIADVKHQRSTKSAVCEHVQQGTNHYLRFDKPQILAKEHRFLPRMIREAIEIKKHPNFNREDGWKVPPAWDPVLHLTQPKKKHNTARKPDTLSSFCVDRTT